MGVQEMDAMEMRKTEGGGWMAYWAGYFSGKAMSAYGEANPVHTCKI